MLHAQWESIYNAHLFTEADDTSLYNEVDCGDGEACSCFMLLLRLPLTALMIESEDLKEPSLIREWVWTDEILMVEACDEEDEHEE